MPNQQKANKRYLTILATRKLIYQMDVAAQRKGVTRSVLANEVLEHEFGNIKLPEASLERIRRETIEAIGKGKMP